MNSPAFEQPTKFELVFNLKTTKQMGARRILDLALREEPAWMKNLGSEF